METKTYQFKNSRISYVRLGSGPELLLALHGFSQNKDQFQDLKTILGQKCIIIAPDLPFHGNTIWAEEDFTPELWAEVLKGILEVEGHPAYRLLGFSYGARLCMGMVARDLLRPKALYLLSPDGLSNTYLQFWERSSGVLLPILKLLLRWPNAVVRFGEFLQKVALLDNFQLRFLRKQLEQPAYRTRLVASWSSLRKFSINKKVFADFLKHRNLPLHVCLGRHDPLVDIEEIQKLVKTWPNASLTILDKGHQIIGPELGVQLHSTFP